MNIKFKGICLITNNVPVLTNFYREVLGVSADGNELHTELKTNGATLSIFSTQGMEDMAHSQCRGLDLEASPWDLK